MLGIGINYIRFAVEEPNLFRFLFQSGFAVENNLLEMIDSPELVPVISAMQKAIGMNIEQTKKFFLTISLFAHGYASIIANNSLEYDEELIKSHLERAYRGYNSNDTVDFNESCSVLDNSRIFRICGGSVFLYSGSLY